VSVDFQSPSYRAGGGDLTIQVSPLGLIELADEEFEVHGPRIQRYATSWAFYLGNHWGYRREAGEPQVTFNYVKAFTDYIINFTFGRGVSFRSPKETDSIVPDLLKRVWEVDNDKETVLYEMGQQGGVSGDCFVKVAYEEARLQPPGPEAGAPPLDPGITQQFIPGRVRIIPLNSSFCLTPDTEVLTQRGWLDYLDLKVGDMALSLDPDTDEIVWTPVEAVNVFDWKGPMARWENDRMSVISTPDHRWVYEDGRGKRSIKTTADLHESKHSGGRLVVGGGTPMAFSPVAKYDDDLVELVGWFVTEGHWHTNGAPMFTQSESVNEEKAARIDRLVKVYGGSVYRYEGKATQWYVPRLREEMHGIVGDDKTLTPEFLATLTYAQARALYEVLLDGDGHRGAATTFAQSDRGRMDGFQMLTAMLGLRTQARWRQRDIGQPCGEATVYGSRYASLTNLQRTEVEYDGKVWCPTTGTGTWVARRKGSVFTTGNCFPEWHPHDRNRLLRFKLKYRFWGTSNEGTRQVFTYTEILTDTVIEEYVNDELIASRPNPLGVIPIVHIANTAVSGSPWGLGDCDQIHSLNRQYNEIATDIADIINYHAAPVTVITGAKANQLEKGPKKVWGGLPKEAQVFNLENGVELSGPMGYMEMLKTAMHEMVGVPETALGQMQPISNTSGVALSIQFQPLMNRYQQKIVQYGMGLQKINELVMKHIVIKEPQNLSYNPTTDEILDPGQVAVLDPDDPITYQSYVHWAAPLPLDKLVLLQEVQMKLELRLESRQGALRILGEEFPDSKLAEIRQEQIDDAKADGVMNLINTQIQSEVANLTGMLPGNAEDPASMLPTDGGGSNGGPGGGMNSKPKAQTPESKLAPMLDPDAVMAQQGEQGIRNDLVTRAYGTKAPQRSVPDAND
jgi:hypothetical protein